MKIDENGPYLLVRNYDKQDDASEQLLKEFFRQVMIKGEMIDVKNIGGFVEAGKPESSSETYTLRPLR